MMAAESSGADPESSDVGEEGGLRGSLLVSACLLGLPCNHRGRASSSAAVMALARDHQLVPICPEVAGGLSIPRAPAELQPDGRVVTEGGTDVTDQYRKGAFAAVAAARAAGVREAVLKARSPSCGCHEVYDGSFIRKTVPGEGVAARALREAGVTVRSEEDLAAEGLDVNR